MPEEEGNKVDHRKIFYSFVLTSALISVCSIYRTCLYTRREGAMGRWKERAGR